jgi:hypothetical protein
MLRSPRRDVAVVALMSLAVVFADLAAPVDSWNARGTRAARDFDIVPPRNGTLEWSMDATRPTPTSIPFGPSRWRRSNTASAYYWAF